MSKIQRRSASIYYKFYKFYRIGLSAVNTHVGFITVAIGLMLNVLTAYSVQNDVSLNRHCTNERRVRKRDKKLRRDVI